MNPRVLPTLIPTTAIVAVLLSSNLSAEAVPANTKDLTKSWVLKASLENISIDPLTAAQARVGDTALSLNFDGEYFFTPNISTTLGLGFLSYTDNDEFTELTQDQFGSRDVSSSDASAIPLYGDIGYRGFFGVEDKAYWTVRAGVSVLVGSKRSIGNCTDCREDKIDLDAGGFLGVGAGYRIGKQWGLGLHYRTYTGDFENSVAVSVDIGL